MLVTGLVGTGVVLVLNYPRSGIVVDHEFAIPATDLDGNILVAGLTAMHPGHELGIVMYTEKSIYFGALSSCCRQKQQFVTDNESWKRLQ